MKKILIIGLIIVFICFINRGEDIIDIDKIKVEVKGEVVNPGVYEIENGKRVIDVVTLSGGFTKKADNTTINMSKILEDEMVVVIYSKDEIASMREGNTAIKYIDKQCVCPEVKNDVCIEHVITNVEIIEEEVKDEVSSEKISLNKATLEQLLTLKGIGETKAKAIIEYRNKTPFKSIEEITNVKGIGKSTFEKIKDRLTI